MDLFFDINWCKFILTQMTLLMVLFSCLLNIFEPYIPTILTQTIRYGKFSCIEKSSLVTKLEVPKSSFRHFYAFAAISYPVALVEVVRVYVFGGRVSEIFVKLLDLACGSNRSVTESSTHVFIALILITLQIYRRFYDTHFVSVFSKNAKINVTHYIVGMIYYPLVVVAILSEAPGFTTSQNVPNNKIGLQLQNIKLYEIFAIGLFFWAWYHQHSTTVILANLRKNKKGEVVKQGYEIPAGDWFDYLSSPHSTAEILMYSALTVLLFNNSCWWYVYAWVISNQVETIMLSHWWYQSHFKGFPRSTKALIPFVY